MQKIVNNLLVAAPTPTIAWNSFNESVTLESCSMLTFHPKRMLVQDPLFALEENSIPDSGMALDWTVAGLLEEEQDDLFTELALLESQCTYAAVHHANMGDLTRIEKALVVLEWSARNGSVTYYFEASCACHRLLDAIAEEGDLHEVVQDLKRLRNLLRVKRQLQLERPERIQASLAEYRQLLKAFQRRDADMAEKIMFEHVMRQRAALVEICALEKESS